MAVTRLQQVLDIIAEYPVKRVCVAAAEDDRALSALREAQERNIAEAMLVGDEPEIRSTAERVGYDLSDVEILPTAGKTESARRAASLVREGRADLLMKGHIHTDDFLRGLLDKEHGLRTGSVMSHVFVLDTAARGCLTFVTDGGMNICPNLETKADIILNAVYLAQAFGIERPKVAVVCAIELINPKMPATMDAAALAVMCRRRQFPNCQIEGPLALDNAVSLLAAQHKKISGEVAGQADILVVPNIEAGNILAKSFSFLAGGLTAGVLVGAAAPVVLPSRADTAEAKLYSLATAILMVNMQRHGELKVGRVHY